MILATQTAEPASTFPPPLWTQADGLALLLALSVLGLSACLAVLRVSLARSHSARVLAEAPEGRRRRLERLLARTDALITSAGVLKLTCDLCFLVLLMDAFARRGFVHWVEITGSLVVAVPVLFVVTESLPAVVARRHGDTVLVRALPIFYRLQLPLWGIVVAHEWSRRALMRVVGVRADPHTSRDLVEGLRDVVEDAGRSERLDDTERELIENVMEFGEVDVAAVMTPRTEIHGIELSEGLGAAIELAAREGHSRIPVYRETIDSVVGWVSARGVVDLLANDGDPASARLEDHLQPAYFVPETKPVAELLKEFRSERQKMAIVLDEYGGTAGLVTLGDVLGEIVGEIQETFDHEEPDELREVAPGVTDVDAGLHVSEVNEALELELPEESDFETLGGFVLAELGHFPKCGERFDHDGASFEVLEASDRRVITVRVTRETDAEPDGTPEDALSQRAG